MTNHVDEGRGLYHKYTVHRMFDWDHKHDDCRFFTLDPLHDPIARRAIKVYAVLIKKANPKLSQDLKDWMSTMEEANADADHPENP